LDAQFLSFSWNLLEAFDNKQCSCKKISKVRLWNMIDQENEKYLAVLQTKLLQTRGIVHKVSKCLEVVTQITTIK
jgi:hypothetical protein